MGLQQANIPCGSLKDTQHKDKIKYMLHVHTHIHTERWTNIPIQLDLEKHSK